MIFTLIQVVKGCIDDREKFILETLNYKISHDLKEIHDIKKALKHPNFHFFILLK